MFAELFEKISKAFTTTAAVATTAGVGAGAGTLLVSSSVPLAATAAAGVAGTTIAAGNIADEMTERNNGFANVQSTQANILDITNMEQFEASLNQSRTLANSYANGKFQSQSNEQGLG